MARKSTAVEVPTDEAVMLMADMLMQHGASCLNWDDRPMHMRRRAESLARDVVESIRTQSQSERGDTVKRLETALKRQQELEKDRLTAEVKERKAWEAAERNVKRLSEWEVADLHRHAVEKSVMSTVDNLTFLTRRLAAIKAEGEYVSIQEKDFGTPPMCADCASG